MRNLFLICLSLVLFSNTVVAQLDDIKKKSEKYKNDGNGSEYSNDDDYNAEMAGVCFESCASVCFDIFFSQIGAAMMNHHRNLLDNRQFNPFALSLDFWPTALYMTEDDVWGIQPRVRGTAGIFSTDLKMDFLAKKTQTGFQKFEALHWQILVLNFSPASEFNIRFGGGIFTDRTDKLTFFEGYSGIQIRAGMQSTLITLEGRLSFDPETQDNVYKEFNLLAEFRAINQPGLFGYFTAGVAYQNYYPESYGPDTSFFLIQGGMHFNLH